MAKGDNNSNQNMNGGNGGIVNTPWTPSDIQNFNQNIRPGLGPSQPLGSFGPLTSNMNGGNQPIQMGDMGFGSSQQAQRIFPNFNPNIPDMSHQTNNMIYGPSQNMMQRMMPNQMAFQNANPNAMFMRSGSMGMGQNPVMNNIQNGMQNMNNRYPFMNRAQGPMPMNGYTASSSFGNPVNSYGPSNSLNQQLMNPQRMMY